MSTTTVSRTFDLDRDRIRRALAPTAIAVAVVSGFWTVLGAHNLGEIVVVLAVIAIATGVVYGIVLPKALRKPAAGGTGLGLSVPAVLLTLPAFWSGLPLVLGIAGAMLGCAGRGAASGSGKSIAACALGLLAAVAYLTIYVVDGVILGHL